ncbi:OprO/OprP family phosphate-selective porin [Undibacterium sp. Jales W-56]|uniref:OprO/OprP family phosphate-selective porin n=1 Tax=Undibacterium sp. Jales W-56 TaxID=2897325 RepID=UPI0021CF99A5|nr:OprO/OprP family phosphate-selective porin [Undibacterium sp. Jales W-56]MCU6434386.1 OprO/OprP family phosphate-selective porin [Undibacterium sp. Jales W-56]
MKKTLLAQALCIAFVSSAVALPVHASEAELLQKIEKLAAELDAIKAELVATRKQAAIVEKKQEVLANTVNTTVANNATTVSAGNASMASAASNMMQKTVISSYGEISYSRPTKATNQAQTDVGRAVIGITHRFDEKTKMVAEFEWEHAIASSGDKGETEVEQLYVEHELNNNLRAKAGLFLMPVGLLNTTHEPTAYYGVQRNFVETAIIPTTWREVGAGLSGSYDNGVSWDAGLTTGFDLSKWSATSSDGSDSPLRSIHQEGQLAKSRDLSLHAALNWRGIPGLLVGGSVFTGKAGHGTTNFAGNDARVTLWDVHTRFTPGRWDLSALYSRGTISNTEALNLTFVGQPTPVPSSFFGWYTQAAYQLWKSNDYSLTPFLRYEQFNTANSYAPIPQGLGVAAAGTEKVTTLGTSFKIGEGVVLKADYQKFKLDNNRDRLNLGVGYSF